MWNFGNHGLGVGVPRLRESTAAVTCNVNNTTGSKTIFTLTGAVWVYALWAEVTTNMSSNHTAGHIRLNDATATVDVTEAATGVTLSSRLAGTLVFKEGLAAAALTLMSNAAGAIEEPAAAGTPSFSPVLLVKKTAATTTLDYRYTTNNAPSSGVLTFHALWLPLSSDGNLT